MIMKINLSLGTILNILGRNGEEASTARVKERIISPIHGWTPHYHLLRSPALVDPVVILFPECVIPLVRGDPSG
jgi:hypothetical protein